MELTGAKKQGIKATIFSLYFFAPTISAISPALASMASAYPTIDVATLGYIVTITAAFQAVTAVLAGLVAGKAFSFKSMLVFASLLYVLSGCFPYLLQDGEGFEMMLVTRALFGVATGIVMPLSNSLVMAFFDDKMERASLIGKGNVFLNLGTIVTNLIGGYLCLISWQTTFLVYGLGIVMLVFSIFCVPAGKSSGLEDEATKSERSSSGFPLVALTYILIFLMAGVATQPLLVYNAQFLSNSGIGDSVTAGYMITFFSIGGILASWGFSRIFNKIHEWLIPLSFVIIIAAALLGFIGSNPDGGNLVLYATGIFLSGFALLLITCCTPLAVTVIVKPEMTTTAMGLIAFATAIGTFLAAPFAQLVTFICGSDDVRLVLLGAIVCAVITGIISFFFVRMRQKTIDFSAGDPLG